MLHAGTPSKIGLSIVFGDGGTKNTVKVPNSPLPERTNVGVSPPLTLTSVGLSAHPELKLTPRRIESRMKQFGFINAQPPGTLRITEFLE